MGCGNWCGFCYYFVAISSHIKSGCNLTVVFPFLEPCMRIGMEFQANIPELVDDRKLLSSQRCGI